MSRDNFTAATKRRLAGRAGYLCAYPGCPHPRTIGAAKSGDGVIVIGIAAHITAASAKGPRFDVNLTPEQRSHHSNGVWMCTAHGKAVDDDDASFPVELLRKWKTAAAEPFTVFGGALLTDDGQRSTGMFVVLDVPDRAAAEDFVSAEPYARAGLFENVAIRQFRQMTPALTPGFLSEELQRELASREPSSR